MSKVQPEKNHLFVVREGAQLFWPAEIYPVPAQWGNKVQGFKRWMQRNHDKRVRGEGGYVVDMSAPFERKWCKGQERCLQPVGELGRKAPRKATEIDFQPAALLIQDHKSRADAARVEEVDTVEGEGGRVGGRVGGPSPPPYMEGAMFMPYEDNDAWRGVYVDAEANTALYLLPHGDGAEAMAMAMVPEDRLPSPLVPEVG
jgi:hypothetical protein